MSTETMTGYVAELGGSEIGKTGKEKPRKVVLKKDLGEQYGKTFRVWSSSYQWDILQNKNGQLVTLEYVVEERQGGPNGSYTQNMITDVLEDVGGGGNGAGDGEVVGAVTAPSDDWSVPAPEVGSPSAQSSPRQAAPPPASTVQKFGGKKDDVDWEARTLEIESAWAIGVLLNRAGSEKVSPQKLVQDAIALVILKRQVASELAK